MERGNENVYYYKPYNAFNQAAVQEDLGTQREMRRQWLQRQRAKAYERARTARTGLWTLALMADWAIRMAAHAEPDRGVRRQRRRILANTWMRYSGDLMRQTGRL